MSIGKKKSTKKGNNWKCKWVKYLFVPSILMTLQINFHSQILSCYWTHVHLPIKLRNSIIKMSIEFLQKLSQQLKCQFYVMIKLKSFFPTVYTISLSMFYTLYPLYYISFYSKAESYFIPNHRLVLSNLYNSDLMISLLIN